jgi:hypothetical protein
MHRVPTEIREVPLTEPLRPDGFVDGDCVCQALLNGQHDPPQLADHNLSAWRDRRQVRCYPGKLERVGFVDVHVGGQV